jgi:hypothetical protein
MDRKEAIRKYKETPRPAGVYRIHNAAQGKSLIGTSLNLPGALNRERFQLENGSHPDRELQKDWKELGPDAFALEILDQLEPKQEASSDVTDDLQTLLQMWIDKLVESGEQLYPMTRSMLKK